jgi:SAM-dependent methyltransferase
MTDAFPSALDFWNGRFAAEGYLFGTEPNAFLAREAGRLARSSRVLMVADGEGRNGVHLATLGHHVLSVDFSPVAQAKARALAAQAGVALDFLEADLLAWEWPEAAFDAVVAIFIQFAGAAARPGLFAGLKRALKPGGLLLLEGYTPRQLAYGTGGPPVAENLYNKELLEAEFGAFERLLLAEYDAVIEEGSGHKGLSALIDLIARKPV